MLKKNGFPSSERAFLVAFFAIASLLATTLVLLTWISFDPVLEVSSMVLLTIFAHSLYGVALYCAFKSRDRLKSVWVVLALSLGLRLILIPSEPVYSDDIYRYVWDGKTLAAGVNPYSFSPEEVEPSSFGDPIWKNINNRELGTIYPPFAQLIFAGIAFVCPCKLAFKAMSALADFGVILMVILLAGARLEIQGKKIGIVCSKNALMAGLTYGLNPLCCIETGMSGHLEPFAVLPTLAAILLLVKGRSVWASFLLGLGTGVKLIPVFLIPLLRGKRVFAFSVFGVVLIGLYLPFISAGLSTVETLDTFVRRWEGNSGVFAVVKGGVTEIIGAAYGVTSINELVHVKFLDPVAGALQGTFFSLHKDGGFDPKYPGKLSLCDLSLAVTKLIMAIALSGVVFAVAVRRVEPKKAAAFIFGTFLIITPILHPWYLIWILPLAAILRLWPWMVLAALSTLAYLPLDLWWSTGVWKAPLWIPVVEYGGFTLAVILYLTLKLKAKKV